MNAERQRILVTGSAGFIGFHVCEALLDRGHPVLGIDNFSDYYDVALKEARHRLLQRHPSFSSARLSIEDADAFGQVWRDFAPDIVIHLAAQAGVRYSIDHPHSYIGTNVVGTFNLLELARHHPVRHLLAASTSSIYGANDALPFGERQATQTPLSLYAATKGASELIGHSYSHLYRIPTTFFRFFTVYGPWGRPDMALMTFAHAISEGGTIDVYNNGEMTRDFTYIDDLAAAIVKLIDAAPGDEPVEGDSLSPVAPFRIVNIGGGQPTRLTDYIDALETALGAKAKRRMLPMQQGDMIATGADNRLLQRLVGEMRPTPLAEGMRAFADWYRDWRAQDGEAAVPR